MPKFEKPIRIVMAKPGLDGHDQGILLVSKVLADAGMEVIYIGLRQTPEQIVQVAIQEDANVIGMSMLSETHMEICPKVLKLLKERHAEDIKVIVGGIYHKEDFPKLKEMGIAAVFGVDTKLSSIPDAVKAIISSK